MLLKIVKTSVLVAITACTLSASSFNAQAEKDRLALSAYTVAKFKDAAANKDKFFPYSSDEELKKYKKNLKYDDFKDGSYSYNMIGKESRDDMMEMPPFEDDIETGEALYNKHFSKCFTSPAVVGEYPKYDENQGKVITLSTVAMKCAKDAGLKIGKKDWDYSSKKMTQLQAYMSTKSQEAEKKVNIKIESAAAAAAYENGKKEFYSERGYLKLSCATCHVQGAGQRVRLENMSMITGGVTHFPVYRIGKEKMFTLEGRLGGCNRNQGEKPHKAGTKWSSDILYFVSYMSNGMDLNGPDVRR